jgi:hypothetical protein
MTPRASFNVACEVQVARIQQRLLTLRGGATVPTPQQREPLPISRGESVRARMQRLMQHQAKLERRRGYRMAS